MNIGNQLGVGDVRSYFNNSFAAWVVKIATSFRLPSDINAAVAKRLAAICHDRMRQLEAELDAEVDRVRKERGL